VSVRRVFRLGLGRTHIAREVDDELAFHLETRTQRLVASGWSPEAARAEALRQFGDLPSVRASCVTFDEERARLMKRANFYDSVVQDIVYAIRTLRRNRGFTAVVVLALALGIGANTAIFTLVNALLVRTLPVDHPMELVALGDPARTSGMSQGSVRTDIYSYPLYKDVRDRNQVLSGLAASGRTGRLDARIAATSASLEHPRGRFVSENYFKVLGVGPARGRVFDGTEDRTIGSSPVAVISYGYWTRRFRNDPSVIGRAVVVNGQRVAIVGVAAEPFNGEIVGAPIEMWLPLTMHDVLLPHQPVLTDRLSDWLLLLGRRQPGVGAAAAMQQLKSVVRRSMLESAPAGQAQVLRDLRIPIMSGARGYSRVRVTFEAPLLTLMAGVGLLLLIICANVANLLLARAIARGREMSVRLAIGADRSRVVRQLLTESGVLALLSGTAGLAVAWWGSRLLLALASDGASSIPVNAGLDVVVLGFTLLVSMLAVAVFGLAPAIRASRVDVASTMRANAHAVTGSALGRRGQRAPLGSLLITGQVALSIVLLVGAAILVRSLRQVQSVDVGMDRDHLLIVDVDAASRGYRGARFGALAHTLRDAMLRVPGVTAASYSENGIFSGTESATSLEVPGFTPRTANDSIAAYDKVGPEYVRALGGRLVAGRDLTAADEDRPVVLVNETLARFYFGTPNAVGRYLHFNDTSTTQIVGVVADARDHDLTDPPSRRIYFPYRLTIPGVLGDAGSMRFEVRTAGDPSALVQQVRKTILATDRGLPVDNVDPLPDLMRASIRQERLLARLASGFGVLALLLAAVGLYGVMTYAITRRTGEIGLRVALGAQRTDVVRMVLLDALRLVAAGFVLGLPLALFMTRLLRGQLHGVDPADPLSIAAAVAVLATSAVLAVLLPALRASRVSPIVALRAD
jgi:predicted permease